jgi:hypothetical protein
MNYLESEFNSLKSSEKLLISLEFLKELKEIWKSKIDEI